MKLRDAWELLKEAGSSWSEDNAMRMAAALAYYTLLSIAPLLVLAVAIAGILFGEEAARRQVVEQLQGLIGDQGGGAVQTMLEHASRPGKSIPAMTLGVLLLLLGASGVFAELQDDLNTIWEVAPKPGRPIWTILKQRFWSFAMVLGTGFLLLVSLLLSAALAAFTQFVGLAAVGVIGHVVSSCVSFVIITLLFAMLYKWLPDVMMTWGDVWIGAVGTAVLFTVGQLLIGLYLGHSSVGSAYGAAGSLVVFLVWVYYSALILFFGAEFTKVYANRFGSRIRPAANAVPLTQEAQVQQGLHRPEAVGGAQQREPAGGAGRT